MPPHELWRGISPLLAVGCSAADGTPPAGTAMAIRICIPGPVELRDVATTVPFDHHQGSDGFTDRRLVPLFPRCGGVACNLGRPLKLGDQGD